MAAEDFHDESKAQAAAQFATTHWSVVLAARDDACPDAGEALEELCRTYWYPLYAYVRRSGQAAHAAQDLTQGFLIHFLAHGALSNVDHQRGRFRSYLLACLRNYLRDAQRREGALKRGGQATTVIFDSAEAEQRYRLDGVDAQAPDKLYARRWALALLERVMERLAEESDQVQTFRELKPHIAGEESAIPYGVLAAKWGIGESAVRMRVHRLRERYRALLREEIAHTVSGPAEVDAEIRYLMRVLGST